MGVDTKFKSKNLSVNTSWRRYAVEQNVTIKRVGTFPPDNQFFTIGSCFANELRHALEQRSINVLPKINPLIHHLFPEEFKSSSSWGVWDERVQLQFYNTFSIRQEFEKAFGVWQQADDEYICITHAGTTKYWDPYRRAIYTETVETFAELKNALDHSLQSAIHAADVAIITLGMTEVFFRKDNGLATCQYNRFFKDVAEFRVTTYDENYQNIDRICELYFGKYPDRKMILTVSPVALAQTFTDEDVVVANCESKSVLRAVAAAIVRKWKNVIYWPSYEIVLWNSNSFQADLRHVHPDRVSSIMDAFMECHIQDNTSNASTDRWGALDEKIAVQVAKQREVMVTRQRIKDEEQLRLNNEKKASADQKIAERKKLIEDKLARIEHKAATQKT
jgi:hypothetical protein